MTKSEVLVLLVFSLMANVIWALHSAGFADIWVTLSPALVIAALAGLDALVSELRTR